MTFRRSSLAVPIQLLILGALIVLPMGVLITGSFLSTPPRALQFDFSGLTFSNYVEVVTAHDFWALLGTTLALAVIGTLGALIFGAGLAWLAVRTDVPGRRLLRAVAITPMFLPPMVGAFAWDILASPKSGIINILARSIGIPQLTNIYSFAGIGFVFAIYYCPYVYLFVAAALRNMDAVLEEAARMTGAGRFRILRDVTLPLIAPSVLSAGLLVFMLLIEIFAIPAVLAEPGKIHVLSVRIWEFVGFTPPKVNQASALGVLLLAITVSLVAVQQRVMAGRSYITVAGKGTRPRQMPLGVWRWPLCVLGFSYLFVAVVIPFAALVLIAFRKNVFFRDVASLFRASAFSTQQFEIAFTDPVVRTALWNSLCVALGVVAIGCTLYFAVAYTVHRTRLRGRRVLDFVAVMPIAIPGLIIGLGYLWSWITLPIGLYGTIWIIVLAYVSQFAPQGVRAISGSLVQIHPELEECSRLSGAGLLTTIRRVVLPLARPGMLAAMTLLLVLSFREFATALFLYTANTQVFSLTMFDFWERGSSNLVAVMALMQAVVLLIVVTAGQILSGGRMEGDA